MADNPLYQAALKKIGERALGIVELSQVAEKVAAAGAPELRLELYKQWIAAEADNPLLYVMLYNYSVLLTARGDLAGTRDALERALALKPDFSRAAINLGGILEMLGDIDGAIARWASVANRSTIVTGVTVADALLALQQMGRVMESKGRTAEAEKVFQKILTIDPTQRLVVEYFVTLRLAQCEWPVISGAGIDRSALKRRMSPLSMTIYADDPLLQLATAWDYCREYIKYRPPCPETRPRAADVERLRIGYLSSDLRSHAVGSLMPEVFELHDRKKVEVFAYYCGTPADDPISARIKGAVEHWVDISGMDDTTAARQIAADGIDILVDINGYTRHGRAEMVTMRPAPIIVNWLGYPGSMGSPYHHYIIADEWIIPNEHEIYYSEKVMRLPCYQPNDRKRIVDPRRPARSEAKLPDEAMVYCCFNGKHKISRATFERWITILSEVPGSVLWLLAGGPVATRQLVEFAGQRGISEDRLIFAPPFPRHHHLARYPLADLFLDTAPYGAHTTASDALWMGVPILTLSGHSFASRVCGSLARSAGLPDLVCSTPEEYVERAIALGKDKAELQRLRKRLLAKRDSCALFDTTALVRHLEKLYRQMWTEFHAGKRPRPDLANLDLYQEVGIQEDHDTVDVGAIKDYRAWFRAKLEDQHRRGAVPEDRRLWTAADIARVEALDRVKS